MSGIYEYSNNYGVKIRIFYEDTVEAVVDIKELNTILSTIWSKCYRYMGNPLQGLSLDIYDDKYFAIPKNKEVYDPVTRKSSIISMGIGNYAGLTWSGSNEIDINDNLYGTPEAGRTDFLANIIAHEVGHLIAGRIFRFDSTLPSARILKNFWMLLRGCHATSSTPLGELIAEDLRRLIGTEACYNLKRGDYVQLEDVKGLEDLYKFWKLALDTLDNFDQLCSITRISWKQYPDKTALVFYADHDNPLWDFANKWVKISLEGVAMNDSSNKWYLAKPL